MLVYLRDGSAQSICACCHIEIEVADQTCCLTQSLSTGPTSPSVDPRAKWRSNPGLLVSKQIPLSLKKKKKNRRNKCYSWGRDGGGEGANVMSDCLWSALSSLVCTVSSPLNSTVYNHH